MSDLTGAGGRTTDLYKLHGIVNRYVPKVFTEAWGG